MKNEKTLLILISLMAFISCNSQKLTRSEASKIISEFYQYPNINYVQVGSEFYCSGLNNFNKEALKRDLLVRKRKFNSNKNCWFDYIDPSRKGAKYFMARLKSKAKRVNFENVYMLSEVDFNEVTGIKMTKDGTSAEVIYTLTHTNISPFGKIENLKENDSKEMRATLELFDDGWRVTDKKSKVYKISNYPRLK